MTAGCDLAAFLRSPRGPARMPLRPCCVAGLVGRSRGGAAHTEAPSCVRICRPRQALTAAAEPLGVTTIPSAGTGPRPGGSARAASP